MAVSYPSTAVILNDLNDRYRAEQTFSLRHSETDFEMTALPPEAAIELELVGRAACDPKRT